MVTFSITYLKEHVKADTTDILWWLLIAHTVHLVAIPTVGRLLISTAGARCFVGRLVRLTGASSRTHDGLASYLLIMAAIILGLVIHALMYAP